VEKIKISQRLSPEELCSVMAFQKELYSQSAFLKDYNPEIIRRTQMIKKYPIPDEKRSVRLR
jgi:hypothetical protein